MTSHIVVWRVEEDREQAGAGRCELPGLQPALLHLQAGIASSPDPAAHRVDAGQAGAGRRALPGLRPALLHLQA